MSTLQIGSTGTAVTVLENQLQSLGFYKGAIDGDFGPMLAAAVEAFQTSKGLVADGVVGPITQAALTAAPTPSPSPAPKPAPTPSPSTYPTGIRKVAGVGPVLKGIDIYQGDGVPNIAKLKGNVDYVINKAFEYVEDPLFQSRWSALKSLGIPRGAYDFFHPGKDPVAQAKNFLSIAGPLQPGDLPHALDWESTDNLGPGADLSSGLAWLEYVEQATGVTPMIYGGPYFLQAMALDGRFARFLLWVADYGSTPPSVRVPQPWETWTFWQYGDTGTVPGVTNQVDSNYFNGDMAAFQAILVK